MKIGFNPPSSPNYPSAAKSAAVISIDFDHLTKSSRSTQAKWVPEPKAGLLEKNGVGTRDLVSLSEKYLIPMSWAICGRTASEDPDSYLLVKNSKQLQDIGVHTYSHIDVSASTDDELKEEIEMCEKVLGLEERPKTFIFPWNRMGHFDLLSKMGYATYRGQDRVIGYPSKGDLWNIPPTYYVDTKSYGAENLIKKYVDLCISWNCVFHLWLHPWSVVLEGDSTGKFASRTLDPVFAYLKQKRDAGMLAVSTMADLASFCENRGDSSIPQAREPSPRSS